MMTFALSVRMGVTSCVVIPVQDHIIKVWYLQLSTFLCWNSSIATFKKNLEHQIDGAYLSVLVLSSMCFSTKPSDWEVVLQILCEYGWEREVRGEQSQCHCSWESSGSWCNCWDNQKMHSNCQLLWERAPKCMRVMQVNIKPFNYFKYPGGLLCSVSVMHYLISYNSLILNWNVVL